MPFLLVGDSPLLLQDLQAYACLLQPQVAHISKMLLLSVAGLDVAQHALGWPECVYPCRAPGRRHRRHSRGQPGLNHPEQSRGHCQGEDLAMFRMDDNTVAIVLAMCHDLKRFWPDHLHHSRRSSK